MTNDEKAPMDLGAFDIASKANEGVDLELRGPNGERLHGDDGMSIVWTCLTSDSKTYQRLQHQQTTNRLNKRVSRGGRLKITGEELEQDAIDIMVACVRKWSGNWEYNGQKLECNPINVRTILEKELWIREQIDEFINDRSNLLGN